MPADVQIRFRADSKKARTEIEQLQGEVRELRQQLGQTQGAANNAATGVDRLGDEARETAREVEGLGNRFRRTGRGATELTGAIGFANRGVGVFTRSLSGAGSVLGALGVAAVGHQIGRFGIESIQAAGRLEQYTRAITQIEGSSEAAEKRLEALIEIANLPGLNFESLTRYSNRLRAAGLGAEDTDKILLTVGQTIVSLGGNAATASLAMEQLIQAVQLGKVDFRDFRTIVQQIPGFLEALGDVHGVEANLDGLHAAYRRVGGSIRDLLIPTFDELSRRFDAPPADSYIVVMDTLQNSILLTKAAIGDLFLPTVTDAARVLSEFLDVVRVGTKDVSTLPEPIQEIVAGAQSLFEALQELGGALLRIVGPPIGALADSLGGLLGEVLELAGALVNLLNPIIQGTAYAIGALGAGIAQLSDHLTAFIGGVADAVEFIMFWRDEGDQASASTDRLTQSVASATAALEEHATAGDAGRARLKDLRTELEQTTANIARYEEELRKASEAGVSSQSTEQFARLLETARARVPELTAEIEKLEMAFGGASAALGENATLAQEQQARLSDLQTELRSANAEVERYEGLLQDAKETAVGETNPAIEQYERQLGAAKDRQSELNTEIDKATSRLGTLKDGTDATTAATEEQGTAVKTAAVAFTEYLGVISAAQRHIQEFENLNQELEGFDDFWRVAAGEVGEYTTAVDLATVSVVDHSSELEALHTAGFFDGLDDPLAAYVAELEATSVAADAALGPLNQVSETVKTGTADFREAEARLYDYSDALDTSKRSHIDFTDVVDRETTPAVEDLTTALDASKQGAELTERAFESLDTVVAEVADGTADAGDKFRDLEDPIEDAIGALGKLATAFADVAFDSDSALSDVAENVESLVKFAQGDISQAVLLPYNIFRQGQEARQARRDFEARNRDAFEDEQARLAVVRHFARGVRSAQETAGGTTNFDGQIIQSLLEQLIGVTDIDVIETHLRDIFDPIATQLQQGMNAAVSDYEDALATGENVDHFRNRALHATNQFFDAQQEAMNIFNALFGTQQFDVIQELNDARNEQLNTIRQLQSEGKRGELTARQIAEATGTDRQAIEDVARAQYGEAAYNAEVAAAQEAVVGDVGAVVEETVAAATEALENIFRLSPAQRRMLAPLEETVAIAQGVVDDLDATSTPQEITRAYTDLANAQTAVQTQIVAFITDATHITEDARQRALTLAGQRFGNEIEAANGELLDALEAVGFQLVTAIRNMSGILSGAALQVQRIPEEIVDIQAPEQAVVQPIGDGPTEAPEVLEREPPTEVFRFSAQQRDILRTLQGNITSAENAIRLLGEDSTPEAITAAYTRLGAAETAYRDQQLAFIEAGVGLFTEDALANARTRYTDEFTDRLFDANLRLVSNLEDVGFALENAFTEASGFLQGTALAIRELGLETSPTGESGLETPPTADTSPTAEEVEQEPPAEVFRFSAQQRDLLRTLQGDITSAENAIRLLGEDSTPEAITAAYTRLGAAETVYRDQQLAFIEAGVGIFTEDALANARTRYTNEFTDRLFDANLRLVSNLEDVGFALENAFTEASGFLQGTALAIRESGLETSPTRESGLETPPTEEGAPPRTRLEDTPESNLLENAVARARFNLTGATTEQGFEDARRSLIRAINAFYDNELKRIDELALSETALKNLRQDNQLGREQALRRATTAQNQFTRDRLRDEESAQAEIERLREDAIAREARRQDEIEEVRDAQIENEADRLDAIEKLNEDHKDRLLALEEQFHEDLDDLQRDRNQTAEDIQREYQRDFQDLQTETARRLFDEEFGDLTADQRSRLAEDDTYQRELFDLNRQRDRDVQDFQTEFGILTPGSPGYGFYRQELESGGLTDENFIERVFGRRGLDEYLQNQRSVTDVEARTETERADIETQAQATATALSEALAPLLQPESDAVMVSSDAAVASKDAATAANDAAIASRDAATAANDAIGTLPDIVGPLGRIETVSERFSDIVDALGEPAADLRATVEGLSTLNGGLAVDPLELTAKIEDAIAMFAEPVSPSVLTADTISVSGNTVHVSGGLALPSSAPAATPPQTIEVTVPVTLNDNILLEQQSRTEQLNGRVNI